MENFMEDFNALGLRPELLRALTKLNFIKPTPIQAASIPPALEGKDIMGTAQTGTGKTGAFAIPLISHLLNHPQDTALVMTPTRELATQVADMLKKFLGPSSSFSPVLLIGGASLDKQMKQLYRSPRLIVGTPGRINDHLQRRSLNLKNSRFLVLDEIDRMLDMGFSVQIDKILTHMPTNRQTLMFSATLSDPILKLSGKYLVDPIRVSMGNTNMPALRVKQKIIETTENEKYDQLLAQLDQRQGSIIVFVKTKWGADKIAQKLYTLRHSVDVMHGDLRQNQRDRALRAFRNYETRIMIATDIAARGLDIPHIEHVINYDLPQCPEDYIHRIGRTGRNGAEGEAVTLVTPQDGRNWKAIRRLLNPDEKPERQKPQPSHKTKKKQAPSRRPKPQGDRFSSRKSPRKGKGPFKAVA